MPTLAVCPEPRASHWRLGPLPPESGTLMLLGWHVSDAIDAGVPRAIAGVLAQSLAGRFRLSFLAPEGTPAVVRADDAEAARRVFGQPAWSYQGQAALLSPLHAPPPAVDTAALEALLSDNWTSRAASLAPLGIAGALRPGVDGDVAGLWLADSPAAAAMLQCLGTTARGAGLGFEIADEARFSALLSEG